MKVYLVEDSKPIRERIKTTVIDAGGIIAGEASTECEAVTGILAACPDIAVVDLRLAEGSGIGVIRKVREIDTGVIIVVLTEFNQKHCKKASLEAGANYFLDKFNDYSFFIVLMESLKQMID